MEKTLKNLGGERKNNMYWKWKSMIIDFRKLPNDKADVVFEYLGVPDRRKHEWQNGWYSWEYNNALEYAFKLDLVKKIKELKK